MADRENSLLLASQAPGPMVSEIKMHWRRPRLLRGWAPNLGRAPGSTGDDSVEFVPSGRGTDEFLVT